MRTGTQGLCLELHTPGVSPFQHSRPRQRIAAETPVTAGGQQRAGCVRLGQKKLAATRLAGTGRWMTLTVSGPSPRKLVIQEHGLRV